MTEGRAALPEDLELLAPGPELASVLGLADRRRLSERDRVRLAQARNRLVSHMQAELFADIYAMSWTEPPPDDEDHPERYGQAPERYPWTEIELALAMRWTRVAAGRRLEQARQLAEDYPQLQAALSNGLVDMPKVLLMCELAGWLEDPETARRVIEKVLPKAPGQTTGLLRARMRRLVLAIDPDAARKRCVEAIRQRRVERFPNEDGTAELWGRCLPPQDAAAAWERITAIARAAKAAGDDRSLDRLRADALLDLLIGEGVAGGQPLSRHTGGLPDADGLPESEPASHEPGPARTHDLDPHATRESAGDVAADDVAGVRPAVEARIAGKPSAGSLPRQETAPMTCAHCGSRSGVTLPAPRKGVVELQVPLLTLLRLAEHPGLLDGWAPVVADIARQIATKQTDGTWRFSVTNALGEVAWHGITRKRPTAETAALVRARDRTCVAPGCRMPARCCDLDHTVDKVRNGHCGPSNMGALCRMHHLFKHADGSRLDQIHPGVFVWTTPRGMQYLRKPPNPLLDAPSPGDPLSRISL